MPDLSNLLGAVYGDAPSAPPRDAEDEAHVEREPAADERGPGVPEWADDEHLDAAFAQWKPGPSADASPAEQAFVRETDDDPPPPLADDLAAALSEALVASSITDHETDVADATAYGGPKPKAYNFSLVDDEVETVAEVQPVHDVDEVDEVQPVHEVEPVAELAPPVHEVEPVAELAPPVNEVEPVAEVEALHEVTELRAVPEVDEVDEDEDEDEDEPHAVVEAPEAPEAAEAPEAPEEVDDIDDHLRRPAPITPQREAAAELTAASRTESESPFAPPSPEPEPMPVASAPSPVVAATPAPEPMPTPVVAPTVTLPTGARRWDRSDDDILPEKQTKKFFSLSLRRG